MSGLILAIFVTSAAVGVISTLLTDHGSTSSRSPASKTVTEQFAFGPDYSVPSESTAVLVPLRSIYSVTGVTLVYVAPSGLRTDGRVPDIKVSLCMDALVLVIAHF